MLHNVIIGGVTIGLDASYQISQTYENIGGRSLRRKLNGSGALQSNWSKVRTVIKGSGHFPEGLSGLDYTASISISCMAPKSIWSATTTIVLPAARRSDWYPHAYAVVGDRTVETSLTIVTNTATLTAVSGATGYLCAYYPTMTVYAEPPSLEFNGRGVVTGWTFTGEEA
jgi:hypothetical protein